MKTLFIFVLVIYLPVNSQIIDPPRFTYEQLNWGQKIGEVKIRLSKRVLSQTSTKDGSKTFLLSYLDTVKSEAIGVGLQFNKQDSVIESIIITSIEAFSHVLTASMYFSGVNGSVKVITL